MRISLSLSLARWLLLTLAILLSPGSAPADGPPARSMRELVANDNLVAWCIVPFDSKKRGPEERAAMLQRLGFTRFAYDWRAEHVATFDAELEALGRHGIKLEAFWFPAGLNGDARAILDALRRHRLQTQLWIALPDPPASAKSDTDKVRWETGIVRPLAEEARRFDCSVGLYNHGGWQGEPENQLAILDSLHLPNVGIVYNLHHGHEHLDRFPAVLKKLIPHLYALSLNGMDKDGERTGRKILPIAQGELDADILRTIRDSGYKGPLGVLGHTDDDAEERLRDNLDGLRWLAAKLDGVPAGPRPTPRTVRRQSNSTLATPGWLIADKAEYHALPITVECRARLHSHNGYNILVASETKASGTHWEIFSMAGSGTLTAYLPGSTPDHVATQAFLGDNRPHDVAMILEQERVRLFCDGKQVADQTIRPSGKAAVRGSLAVARLVEGGIGCDGTLEFVRISQGIRNVAESARQPVAADNTTIGLWKFGNTGNGPVDDQSRFKNPAKNTVTSAPALSPPGNHLAPVDSRLRSVLIDHSPGESYLAVKVDTAGRVFVGAREALFVFEPDGRGGFGPRQEVYRFPPDSIVMGLEMRGDDLYVLTASALYVLPGARIQRHSARAQRILWGLPLDLHVSFHCLAWGPEGDLYLTHGDPLLNYGDWSRPDHWGHWTLYSGPKGVPVPYTGAGAVLRIHSDGTGLQVVAGGLRGPVGLTFGRHWDLFTNDNDHESRADLYAPARLLHVTPHADFAWPRGWMASKSPDRADLLEPMLATLGRGVPCDLVYYDEPLFADFCKDSLLMCRWDRMAVTRYPLTARGATFATDEHVFLSGSDDLRPVGVAVDCDGRIFVTGLYLPGNVVSPHCPSDLVVISRSDRPTPTSGFEIATVPADRLWEDLASPSKERRGRAHVEILRRGGPLLDQATQLLARAGDDDVSLLHLPWLAGRSGSPEAAGRIVRLTHHPRPEVRLQAVRVLAEYRQLARPDDLFSKLLNDTSPAVRLAALAYFFDADGVFPFDAVLKLAAGSDFYLRQTAARLLASRASLPRLREACAGKDAATRLGGVLAAGIRLTVPPVHEQPPERLPLFFPPGNAFFQTKLQFADHEDPIDLRDLGRVGSYTTAERWRSISPDSQQRELYDLLLRCADDSAPAVRLQSAYYLSLLKDAPADRVVSRVRLEVAIQGLSDAPAGSVNRIRAVGPFDELTTPGGRLHPPETGVVDTTVEYTTAGGNRAWRDLTAQNGRLEWNAFSKSAGNASFYAAFTLQSVHRQAVLLHVETPDRIKLWQNGHPVDPSPFKETIGARFLFDARPGSNDLLLRVTSDAAPKPVAITFRCRESIAAELPRSVDASILARRLKESSGNDGLSVEFLNVDWKEDARHGDHVAGRRLFGSLGCVKCHAITPDQPGGGAPSLSEAGKRFTVPYLVESILLPGAQVADAYRASQIVTTKGQVLVGLVVSESADNLELLLPDATKQLVAKRNIEERTVSKNSPMPNGLVRTRQELRDLLAYLLSDNPLPP